MKTCSVVLTFESVDKILWCDHSNETSSAVLSVQYSLVCLTCVLCAYKTTYDLTGNSNKTGFERVYRACNEEEKIA